MFFSGNVKIMKPKLYIKTFCPWCKAAIAFFEREKVSVELQDVIANPSLYDEMKKLSGQDKTPTFVWKDFIVADFSVDEFLAALEKRPDVKEALFAKK